MEKISCSRLNLIRIDNSKLVSFNPQKVSKIKYPRVSVSCSLQLEGSSSTTILLRRFDSLFSDKLSFLTYPNTDEEKSDIIDVLDLSLIIDHHNFKICGHSHGIVCLYNHLGIFLFNPVTMEFRRLPPSVFKHNDDNVDSDYFRFQVGFGYDPKSKDLKVVRVCLSGVEVYDLSTDSWRELKTRMFEVGFIDSQMYHKGFYYWSGDKSSNGNGEHVILSFDMSKEVFQLIPMPRNYKMDLATNISLLAWNGSIVMYAMYVTYDRYPDTEIDIWAMENNYDGRVSWSKLLTMNFETPNLSFGLTPLLILNSYELLLVDGRNYQHLISVNIKTHRVKHLKDVTGLPDKMQAFVFEKSLLSVKGGTHHLP